MAMEDLLRIAERTEDLPDQALAEIAASNSGIESVIAASEIKARADIREGAQQAPQQAQPPVVDQLINMAMRQPAPPMGAPMPPQMQQPMGQPMPPQMGMQQPMPQQAPPQMAPDMAQLAQQMGVPAMNTGGLIRRFQAGSQGTVGGGNFFDFYQQQLGYDPRSILAGNVQAPAGFSLTPEQIEQLQAQYETAMSGTGIYSEQVEEAAAKGRAIYPASTITGQQSATQKQMTQELQDKALEEARLDAARNLLTSSGLPQGNIQPLTPVGSQTPVQAFVPGGQQRTVLPSGYSLFSPTAASGPPAGSAGGPPAGSAGGSAGGSAAVNQQPGGQQADSSAPFGVVAGTTIPAKDTDSAAAFGSAFQPFALTPSSIGTTNLLPYEQSQQFQRDQIASAPIDAIRVKRDLLDAERLQGLMQRESDLAKDVQERAQKLDDLEKDLPTRENIKDRIKEQTRLGMAKSFFDAAGSGSPDFLTAMAQGFGGAAGVMNKMTGQEQKELYQFALDNYNRESQKANRDYTRQQNLLNQINAAQTAQVTLESNRASSDLQRRKMQQDSYYTLMGREVDVAKTNLDAFIRRQEFAAGEMDRFRDDIIAVNNNRQNAIDNVNSIDSRLRSKDADQNELYIDVGNDFASQFNKGAQINENNGLTRVSKRIVAAYQDLGQIDNEMERRRLAIAQVQDDLINEDKIGDKAVLDKYGEEIFAFSGGDADKQKAAFYRKYPHLNPKILAYTVQ
jgi:hypothetical protein